MEPTDSLPFSQQSMPVTHLLKSHLDVILPSTLMFPKWSLPFRYSD